MQKRGIGRRLRSRELAEPRRPRNDFTHLIRSDFVASEPEKFTRDALNLTHAQTQRHQSAADRHQAAALEAAESGIVVVGDRNGCFRPPESDRSGPGFCRTASLRRKPRAMPMVSSAITPSMPASGASRPISSSILPRPSAGTCRFLPVPCLRIDLERLRSELQAMTAHDSNFLLRSHAKCCSNARVDARFTQCFRSAP